MTSIRRALLTASAALLIAVSGAAAQDMSGTWVLAVDLGVTGAGEATFVLQHEGNEITGTYTGALGEQDVTGTIDGSEVVLTFDSEAGKITYTGMADGDTFEGTCEYGQLGSGSFEGSKSNGPGPRGGYIGTRPDALMVISSSATSRS